MSWLEIVVRAHDVVMLVGTSEEVPASLLGSEGIGEIQMKLPNCSVTMSLLDLVKKPLIVLVMRRVCSWVIRSGVRTVLMCVLMVLWSESQVNFRCCELLMRLSDPAMAKVAQSIVLWTEANARGRT